jgi:hypothetical protein
MLMPNALAGAVAESAAKGELGPVVLDLNAVVRLVRPSNIQAFAKNRLVYSVRHHRGRKQEPWNYCDEDHYRERERLGPYSRPLSSHVRLQSADARDEPEPPGAS